MNKNRLKEKDNSEVDPEPIKKVTVVTPVVKTTGNFKVSEFDCNDGTPVPKSLIANVLKVIDNLEVLRKELGGSAITIISGYRTPAHNAKEGGKRNSYHKKAMAADIRVKGHTPQQVYNTIVRLISEGKMTPGGVGLYVNKGFVHYDIRGFNARW